MHKFAKKRSIFNKRLLRIMEYYIDRHPEFRFNQLLQILTIFTTRIENGKRVVNDPFYEEPDKTIKRVEAYIEEYLHDVDCPDFDKLYNDGYDRDGIKLNAGKNYKRDYNLEEMADINDGMKTSITHRINNKDIVKDTVNSTTNTPKFIDIDGVTYTDAGVNID